MIRVTVADNGPGIPPEMLTRIFEPYFTTKPSGSGLGLAVARKILIDHGGDLRAESDKGGGAVFLLDLPIAN
jgi:signal transduction histidine kinase